MFVKQWHEGFPQPPGQLHSEQRKRHPTRPLVRQQNHSPPVEQPSGQPPPCWQVLHVKLPGTFSQISAGEKHGLQGPPPQPTQPWTAPSETPVRVRKSPAPSDPTPRNLKNCRLDDFPASFLAAADVRSIYGARLGIGALRGGHAHGWSPEWRRGVHGIAVFVKQWHAGSLQFPFGPQLHSEQRNRQPTRPLVRQQNHSPDVMQPSGQPPPCWHVLHAKPRFSQRVAGEKHGLHGPPPQPTQLVTAPRETPVRVRKRPVPSVPAPRNLKNCLREERLASERAAMFARSISRR